MKISNLLYRAAIIAIAAVPFTLPETALADTYDVYYLGDGNRGGPIGITDSDQVVIAQPVGPYGSIIYELFVAGRIISDSSTVPNIDFDNGTSCTPTVSAGIIPTLGTPRCNNGREVYVAEYSTVERPFGIGIFTGPNLSDLLTSTSYGVNSSSMDGVVMNSLGDFAWIDGRGENIFEAVDLTTASTPEPNTLLYLGTGVLAFAGGVRRRLFS